MSDFHKGIRLLDGFSGGRYPAWKRMVLAWLAKHSLATYDVINPPRPTSERQLRSLPTAEAEAVQAKEAEAAAKRKQHDNSLAGADILVFLSDTLHKRHVRTVAASEIWKALEEAHKEWQHTHVENENRLQ